MTVALELLVRKALRKKLGLLQRKGLKPLSSRAISSQIYCVRQGEVQGELLVFNPTKQMLNDDEINQIHS